MNTAQIQEKGSFSPEHFHMLLVGTSIRGKKVIKALHQHLVEGTAKSVSCRMHEANFSQFSVRLASIHDEDQRIARMVKFYPSNGAGLQYAAAQA